MKWELYEQTRLFSFHRNIWAGIRKFLVGDLGKMSKTAQKTILKNSEYVPTKAHARYITRKINEVIPDEEEFDFLADIMDYGDKIIFELLEMFAEDYNGIGYRRGSSDGILHVVNPYAFYYGSGQSTAGFKKKVNATKRILKKHLPKGLFTEIAGEDSFVDSPYNYRR